MERNPIVRLRQQVCPSRRKAAREMAMDHRTLRSMELGLRFPQEANVRKFAEYLDTDYDWLWATVVSYHYTHDGDN